MNTDAPLALLGGLSPQTFMRRHWQKKPLLIRGAVSNFPGALQRKALFALAQQDGVESRLIVQVQGTTGRDAQPHWSMRQGPFARSALPPLKQPGWTLLVQGVDLHEPGARALIEQFRFVPDARLDDVMVSYASNGGGVGPHFDSYDVFLLQARGRRRWRIGRQKDLRLQEGVPLKILADFQPEAEFVLEPGDMLYLPPRYAHDGVAQGECMTYSIGFRAPAQDEIARELLQRLADRTVDTVAPRRYRDPAQPATGASAAIPAGMLDFAREAMQAALRDPHVLAQVLGEALSEPKANVWFSGGEAPPDTGAALDRGTRMLYDDRHVFINGEALRASGRDARLMRKMADARGLGATDVLQLSPGARALLKQWCEDGWAHACD